MKRILVQVDLAVTILMKNLRSQRGPTVRGQGWFKQRNWRNSCRQLQLSNKRQWEWVSLMTLEAKESLKNLEIIAAWYLETIGNLSIVVCANLTQLSRQSAGITRQLITAAVKGTTVTNLKRCYLVHPFSLMMRISSRMSGWRRTERWSLVRSSIRIRPSKLTWISIQNQFA